MFIIKYNIKYISMKNNLKTRESRTRLTENKFIKENLKIK